MRTITTQRLVLENFKVSDLPSFMKLIHDYQKSEYSKYDHKWPNTPEELKTALQWLSCNDDFLAVKSKGQDDVIGLVSLSKEAGEKPIFNLGYILHSEHHGHGYAYEACSAYLNYAKNELKAEVFATGTAKENIKSCRLLDKLGFKVEKEEKSHFQDTESGAPIEFVGVLYKKHD